MYRPLQTAREYLSKINPNFERPEMLGGVVQGPGVYSATILKASYRSYSDVLELEFDTPVGIWTENLPVSRRNSNLLAVKVYHLLTATGLDPKRYQRNNKTHKFFKYLEGKQVNLTLGKGGDDLKLFKITKKED